MQDDNPQLDADATPQGGPAAPPVSPTRRPRRKAKKKKSRWAVVKRVFNLILFAGFLLMIQGFIIGYLVMQHFKERAEAIDITAVERVPVSTLFFDMHDQEMGRLFTEDRTLLTREQIPDIMRQAIMAIEDERFYEHGGVDFSGMIRAMARNVKEGRFAQGGSTLSQQLSKHILGDFSKSIDRKAVEAFLAWRLEQNYTKDQIINFYLNRVYFGKGYYGVASAARGYFDKDAQQLSLGEAAMLAGIISAPNRNSPLTSIRRATEKRNIVLAKMVENKFITSAQAAEAKSVPLEVHQRKPIGVRDYFFQRSIKDVQNALGIDDSDSIPPGLRVYTTVDKELQAKVQDIVSQRVRALQKESGVKNKEPLQGAAMIAEADTGAVRAMIGGRNFLESSFDRSTMARRENGAVLQPFLYTLAFEKLGLHPASMINASFMDLGKNELDDEEIALGDPDKDLAKRFLTVHDALALGLRFPATRVGLEVGAKNFVEWLGKAGVGSPSGSDGEINQLLRPLSMWDVTQLYQVLSNKGTFEKLYTLRFIENQAGEKLYEHAPHADEKQILNPVIVEQMNLTLASAAREGRARTLWTDMAFPAPAAGMVGYSVGYRDAWFAGYTPSLVGTVWIGYDNGEKIGSKRLARTSAVPIWNDMMRAVLQKNPTGGEFVVPDELVKVEADRQSGVVRGIGFFEPSPGNIFVYLKQSQIDKSKAGSGLTASNVNQPEDWSSWLGTMFSEEGEDPGLVLDDDARRWKAQDIPPVVNFRMPGIRGDILAADGTPIAATVQTQSLVIAWPSLEEAPTEDDAIAWMYDKINKASSWLGEQVIIPEQDLRSFYKFKRFNPLVVYDKLTPSKAAAFTDSSLAAEGFHLQGVPARVYPYGTMLAHSLGWLKRTQGKTRGKFVADEVIYDAYAGDKGLELVFDEALTGKDGKITMKISPDGFAERIFVNEEATVGNNVRTTINYRLQQIVEHHLNSKHTASVVFLDPNNGDVLAMGSRPTFNPNDFLPALDPQLWQDYVNAKRSPLKNRAFAQHNPPGSVFKVLTTIAGMNAGVFDPNRVCSTPGYYQAGRFRFNLPHEAASGVSFRRAMARSFNTYFMDLGNRANDAVPGAVMNTSKEWGYGEKTGILLPDELTGNVPDKEFILKVHKRNMSRADIANISIGQGDMLATPLQTANFMAAIANNGTLWVPRLVQDIETNTGEIVQTFPPQIKRQIPVHAAEMDVLREGMNAVTTEGTSRRYAYFKDIPSAGKTGTAQVGSKRRPRQIAWYAGFIPLDNPQMAFVAMVEGTFAEDLHGGSDAGALIGKILKDYYSGAKAASAVEE